MAANTGKGPKTGLLGLLRSNAFLQGYHDAKNGVHHRYDVTPSQAAQAAYERGRQFALLYNGDVVDAAGNPTASAVVNLKRAVQLRYVV